MPDMTKRRSKPATVAEINSAARKEVGRHSIGDSLILSVAESGARRWIARVRELSGRRRDVALGPLQDISLADAREMARQLRVTARTGDPILTKRERRKAIRIIPTFREAARQYHESRKAGWHNGKHVAQWITTLEIYVFPKIGDVPVDTIKASHVVEALLPIWNTKPETARRVRQRIAAVLDWCLAKEFRATQISPSAIAADLGSQTRSDGHFAALPYVEVPQLVAKLSKSAVTSNQALLALILTATRSGEIRFAVRSEFDLEQKTWSIPPERMKSLKNVKGAKPHVVALSDFAVDVFSSAMAVSPHKELVFPGMTNKAMSDATMTKALRVAGFSAERATVHGMRSAFRDWAAEKMPHIPDPVAEAALAHKVSDAVEAAYKRTNFLELRRELMAAWAAHCLQREPTALKVAA